MSDEQWLTAAEAALILRVSIRQVHRCGNTGDLITRGEGRRVFFYRRSVEELAKERGIDIQPEVSQTASDDIMPFSDFLNSLRERDIQLEALHKRLEIALLEIDRLQARLEASQSEVQRLQTLIAEPL